MIFWKIDILSVWCIDWIYTKWIMFVEIVLNEWFLKSLVHELALNWIPKRAGGIDRVWGVPCRPLKRWTDTTSLSPLGIITYVHIFICPYCYLISSVRIMFYISIQIQCSNIYMYEPIETTKQPNNPKSISHFLCNFHSSICLKYINNCYFFINHIRSCLLTSIVFYIYYYLWGVEI